MDQNRERKREMKAIKRVREENSIRFKSGQMYSEVKGQLKTIQNESRAYTHKHTLSSI